MAQAKLPGTKTPADTSEDPITYLPATPAPRPQYQAKFLDAFGSKDQNTTTTNTYDSYNRNESNVQNTSDSGNTSVSIGGAAGGGVGEIAPLVIGVFALLGGLFLITR